MQVLVTETRGEAYQMVFPLSLIRVPAVGRALGREALLFLEAFAGHGHTPACIRTRGHAWGHVSFTLFTAVLQAQKTAQIPAQLSLSQPGENSHFFPRHSLPLSETGAYPGTCVCVSLRYSLDYLGTKEVIHVLSSTNIHLVELCLGAKS